MRHGPSRRTRPTSQQFGLAEPRIAGRLQDGRRQAVARAADRRQDRRRAPTSTRSCATEKKVFLIPSSLESTFNRSTFDLREKTVLKPSIGDKVDRFEIRPGRRPVALAPRRTASGSSKQPLAARADFGAVEGLVGRLQSAQMKSIAAADAADLKAYGLDKPAATVTIGTGEFPGDPRVRCARRMRARSTPRTSRGRPSSRSSRRCWTT